MGVIFWCAGALALYVVGPNSRLAASAVITMKRREKLITFMVAGATVLLCILPMSLNPIYNGEIPAYRNQYEVLTEAILDGHIYMDLEYNDTDPKLLEMDNPYDPVLRREAGVSYHWDHAFYNGHYYMYFGVVPVFLLFLPFRVITGTALTTYHATQVFVAAFIVGIFMIFYLLAKKYFPALSHAVYLSLSTAFSIMSVWYIVDAPALYCTAIAAGLCMEIWSLFFFAKAVWDSAPDRQAVGFGVLGSLFGALAFGCRPTIALANLLAVPMMISYIKGKKFDLKLAKQIAAVSLPYVIIGALLMTYNYVRFEDPFEFGQSYQLTVADQSGYGSVLSRLELIQIVNGLAQNFIAFTPLKETFPYVSSSSVLINFPICALALLFLLRNETRMFVKEKGLCGFLIVLVCLPILITVAEVLMSPKLLERYRTDIYWLMGLLSYLSFGIFYQTTTGNKKHYGFFLSIASYLTILKSFLLWAGGAFTAAFPEYLDTFARALSFGIGWK